MSNEHVLGATGGQAGSSHAGAWKGAGGSAERQKVRGLRGVVEVGCLAASNCYLLIINWYTIELYRFLQSLFYVRSRCAFSN